MGEGGSVRAGVRPEYFPVFYRESLIDPRSRRVFGYDMTEDISLLIERTRDTAAMSLTGGIELVSAQGNLAGFLALVPLYRPGAAS
jgi:CHASE1-domain containing sensor protein